MAKIKVLLRDSINSNLQLALSIFGSKWIGRENGENAVFYNSIYLLPNKFSSLKINICNDFVMKKKKIIQII